MFEGLTQTITRYNTRDLLKRIAACQLIPKNVERTIRLEAIATCIASVPYTASSPVASGGTLRRMCDGYIDASLRNIVRNEDPYENLFTESIVFFDGSYTVFPGIVEDAAFITKHLLKAIFLLPKSTLPAEFVDKAYNLAIVLLSISNNIAEKANYTYGMKCESSADGQVKVPDAAQLQMLGNAICFPIEELNSMYARLGVPRDTLDPLISRPGEVEVTSYQPDNSALYHKPFVRFGEEIIVSLPGTLLATLRHAILRMAKQYQCLSTLAESYRYAVWNTVVNSLEVHLGLQEEQLVLPTSCQSPKSVQGVFEIDTDKLLLVELFTDDMSNYADYEAFGQCDTSQYGNRFPNRVQEATEYIFQHSSANEVMVLLLCQHIGRAMRIGLSNVSSDAFLMMSASDLETLAIVAGQSKEGHPLHLYKYALAKEKSRDMFWVNHFSELDTYNLYVTHDSSFYLSDEVKPNAVYVSPGDGAPLRERCFDLTHLHGAMTHEGGFCEVSAFYPGEEIPIYLPSGRQSTRALLVEGYPFNIWVKEATGTFDPVPRLLYALFIDAISYWLWQVYPWFISHVPGQFSDPVVIEVWLESPDETEGEDKTPTTSSKPVSTVIKDNGIQVYISSAMLKQLEVPDNSAERELMSFVLMGISQYFSDKGLQSEVTQESLNSVLDFAAPVGQKKKLIFVDQLKLGIQVNQDLLPEARIVDNADNQMWLDEIGEFLTTDCGYEAGEVPEGTTSEVLNKVVEFLYSKLQAMVRTLKNDGLLNWLMLNYESILVERQKRLLTIPTEMACFSDNEQMVTKLSREIPQLNQASISARFLIEYVAVSPPDGYRPMSYEMHDRLLSLASQIIHWANYSDIARYKIANVKLSILPSGRLGVFDDAYRHAVSKFLAEHTEEQVVASLSHFPKYWNKAEDETENENADIDEAFRDEFGLSLRDIAEFIGMLIGKGAELDTPVVTVSSQELMDWGQDLYKNRLDVYEKLIGLFSLPSRMDYLSPPKPFRREDVYPWRFNRELSYIRRPLIQHGNQVFWGNGNMYLTGKQLLSLCLNGKLKARSNKMKQLMSTYLNEQGKHFNSKVTALFQEISGLIVRQGVKKIGKLRIANEKGDLGDIDVLVIDQSNKTVYAIECKDLSIAKNPFETYSELCSLFYGSSNNEPYVSKHIRRAKWLADNLTHLLSFYGIVKSGKWHVRPVIVLDEPMLSPHLHQQEDVSIVSFTNLQRVLSTGRMITV